MRFQAIRFVASISATVLTGLLTIYPVTGSAAIDEMIVEARKTSESLQDIPVSVAAFNSEFIEKQGLTTTADIVKLVPGVQFDQSFSAADTRISIRGISNSRGRASVAVLVDGIDVSGENITAGGGSSLLNTRLLDLERVEIIKGPQSALYGRNAFAGAVNYITKQPSMEGLEITTYGDLAAQYSIYDVRGSISGPVVADRLALSVNVGAYSSDGYYENNNLLEPEANVGLGGSESVGGRLVALWTPTDSLSITASASYTENKSEPRAVAKVGPANTFYNNEIQLPAGTRADFTGAGVLTGIPAIDNANVTMNYGQWLGTVTHVQESSIALSISERTGQPFVGSEDNTFLTYLKANWDTDAIAIKSITSYLYNEAFLNEDVDFQSGFGTPTFRTVEGVQTNFSLSSDYLDKTDTKYIAQELTIESNNWDRGRWLLGASGFWEETENKDFSVNWFNDPNFAAGLPNFCVAQMILDLACSYRDSVRLGDPAKNIDRTSKSYSAFGLLGFDITDSLSATVEIRYIHDEIEVSTNTSVDRVGQTVLVVPIDHNIPLGELPTSATQRSDTINPRFALDYAITDDVLLFASAARGTKPAGFGTAQMAVPQNTKIDQEKLWGYELGAKTAWLDNTVQANVSLFWNDYTDRQVGVTVRDPVTGWASAGVVNAAKAETKGVELDMIWQPIDPLSISAAYAYTNAEWNEFKYADIRRQETVNNDPLNPAPVDIREKDRAICGNAEGDCSGAEIAGIPEHAGSMVINWTSALSGDIEWFINTIGTFEDKRTVSDQVNTAEIDSRLIFDAQIGIQTETWSAQLYVDNVLDDNTVRWAQSTNDFRDGMFGGSSGGEPRDDVMFAFLPPPRVIGVRATWKFGN